MLQFLVISLLLQLVIGGFCFLHGDSGFVKALLNLYKHVGYFLVSHISFRDLRKAASVEFPLALFFIEFSLEDFQCFLHIKLKEEVSHEFIS